MIAVSEMRDATEEFVMLAFINEILASVVEQGDVVVMGDLTSYNT